MTTRIRRQVAVPAQVSPPDLRAVVMARVASKGRVSLPHAAVIVQLAGLGPQEAR